LFIVYFVIESVRKLLDTPSYATESTRLGYGLDDRGSILGKGTDFSLRHRVQRGSAAHPTSYPMGIAGSFSGGTDWPLTSIYCRGYECVLMYLHYAIRLHGVVL